MSASPPPLGGQTYLCFLLELVLPAVIYSSIFYSHSEGMVFVVLG